MDGSAPTIGHNSDVEKGTSAKRLKSFIERVERLEVDKANILTDVREIYSEARSAGFDAKIMRKVVGLRKMDKAERAEQESLIQVYLDALE